MKLSERQLRAMTDWFDSIDESDQESYSERVKKFTTFNDGDKRYRLFCYVTDLMDKNGLPLVLPDRKYKHCIGQKLYRGVYDVNFNASTLADFDYHKGDGIGCLGIYATDDEKKALYFSQRYYFYNKNKPNKHDVVTFKLNRDSKIIDYDSLIEICNELRDFADKKRLTLKELYSQKKFTKKCANNKPLDEAFESKQRLKYFLREIYKTNKKLYEAITSSKSTMAILLGFDAIEMNEEDNVVILNRGKIIVSESEYKRITDASKNYKGGVIDFDEKQESEFLRE